MQKKIRLVTVIFLASWVSVLLIQGIYNNSIKSTDTLTVILTPMFSENANNLFSSMHEIGTDLNSGITINRIPSANIEQARNITYVVFNHTDESIIFPDQGFGLSIYQFNVTDMAWEKLPLPHFPEQVRKTLPPKLDGLDLNIRNVWTVLENDVDSLPSQDIRLYVSGSGQKTNTIYGAFMDVKINLQP